MTKVLLFIFLSVYGGILKAQYTADYSPIHKSGNIPAAFITDPVLATKRNVESNKILTRQEAEAYYSEMNFLKSQLFQSGQLYLQNEITLYIDSITEKLLLVEPRLKNEVKVFVTRYTQANASCFPDGSVFINIGLIALLENESELAFILAHEIAHYAEQHSVKDLKRVSGIQKEESNYNNKSSGAYRSLRFSRESEFDADGWALQLMAQAGYDPRSAISALAKLKPAPDSTTINFGRAFNNSVFTVDTAWLSKAAIKKAKRHFEEGTDNSIAAGKLDDLFQTHPDLDKRIEALDLMAKNITKKTSNRSDIAAFSRIRQRAEFERVENNYNEQDYLNAIINSLRLLRNYPDNVYLHVSVSRSLYWLSYYKEISQDQLSVNGDKDQNTTDFYKLYALINKMNLKDAKKLAYAYVREISDKYQDKEPVLFYLAVNTDNYLGKNAARNYYRDYQSKYPKGTFSAYTKTKLQ